MRKKILITGSNGLLGQKLVSLILKENEYDLIATARGENRIKEIYPEMKFSEMDITKRDEVLNVISSEKPDYVIHTAAMTQVDDCETNKEQCDLLNVKSVEYLTEACELSDCHLVHLSTDFIFDGKNGPYKENDIANPISYYGESKLRSENVVKKSKTKWAIVRTVLVFGIVHKMSRSNIILWVKKSLEEGKSINVVNDQWRTPTLAEDLAKGCYLICKNNSEGVFNISGPDLLTPYDMAILTADYFKLNKNLIKEVDGSIFKQAAKRPPKTGFVLDKAMKELNYKPHSFSEGIEIIARQTENS
ncbi:SDR family oxidoreductase [Hyphobacterium sp. CCMP332]|nr:SDR family oxidoreductase [Hyphobacterium sp. CCMP332]